LDFKGVMAMVWFIGIGSLETTNLITISSS
jgi:hypothetical protein